MKIKKIKVQGIVQGVGFRPFVYNLAVKIGLNGWVNNDDKGVNIVLSSKNYKLYELFLKELRERPPVLSKIDSMEIEDIESDEKYLDFKIIKSENTNNKTTMISPDIAICQDCIDDINNKNNFRYNYALTNCTNCGPRYTIIKTVPYDRCNTSMEKFKLCEKCNQEYNDPSNRRYHAQPVACAKCGPNIALYNNKNEKILNNIEAIKETANMINNGYILAIKGMGGFHLVCDATNEKAIKELRKRKNRPTKPFAVLFKDLKDVKIFTKPTFEQEKLVSSKEKPIVLIPKNNETILSELLAPNIDYLGCFISYTPLHYLLFRYLKNPIVATSANLKDEPIILNKDEVIKKLGNVVDYVCDYNRDIINACDDSVVNVVANNILTIRNARGYAPTHIKLNKKIDKKILSLGANQKSTISIAFEDNLILSPHIGDLNSIESIQYLERTIETFKRFYDFNPDVIVCDKHLNYESTKIANKLVEESSYKIKLKKVQHHYAHILSTMAEYSLKEKVLGFSFDGTGYGDDGKIWGGEVFLCDNKNYKRINYFNYFKLLGGEFAIKEPRRVALSLLFDVYTYEEILKIDNPTVKTFKPSEIKLLYTMYLKSLNTVETSSIGRLFDAIASFAGIVQKQSYEGETGMQIEKHYDSGVKEFYKYDIKDGKIILTKMIKEIVKDKDIVKICSKFINMLIDIIFNIAKDYEKLPIIVSGGVFQNKVLLEKVIKIAKDKKRILYYSKKIPLNDGGISVGQIYSQV